MVHRVSKTDLNKVKNSEDPLYQWVTLPVKLTNGQVVTAHTLLRLSRGDIGISSRRYRQILIEGAIEHGLPESYISEQKNAQSVYFPIASELMGDVMQSVVMQRSGKCSLVIVC